MGNWELDSGKLGIGLQLVTTHQIKDICNHSNPVIRRKEICMSNVKLYTYIDSLHQSISVISPKCFQTHNLSFSAGHLVR